MELAVDGLSIFIHHLEGVRAVAVHVAMAVGDAPIAKEERDLVGGFGTKSDEVPEHVGILEEKKIARKLKMR